MSNETKWTPGPWSTNGVVAEPPGGLCVCQVSAEEAVSGNRLPAEALARDRRTARANANLIAAAPDLYAALEEVSSMLDALPRAHNSHSWDTVKDCVACDVTRVLQVSRTALRRARGETP